LQRCREPFVQYTAAADRHEIRFADVEVLKNLREWRQLFGYIADHRHRSGVGMQAKSLRRNAFEQSDNLRDRVEVVAAIRRRVRLDAEAQSRRGCRCSDFREKLPFSVPNVVRCDTANRSLLRRAEHQHTRSQRRADVDDCSQVRGSLAHVAVASEHVQFGTVEQKRLHGADLDAVIAPERAVLPQSAGRQRARIVGDPRRRDLHITDSFVLQHTRDVTLFLAQPRDIRNRQPHR